MRHDCRPPFIWDCVAEVIRSDHRRPPRKFGIGGGLCHGSEEKVEKIERDDEDGTADMNAEAIRQAGGIEQGNEGKESRLPKVRQPCDQKRSSLESHQRNGKM